MTEAHLLNLFFNPNTIMQAEHLVFITSMAQLDSRSKNSYEETDWDILFEGEEAEEEETVRARLGQNADSGIIAID